MKYLPLRDFDDVTNALNFDTADCHVIGGCDLYTTKAAGADKKLYKNIENSLETQLRLLPPPPTRRLPPREEPQEGDEHTRHYALQFAPQIL
ncbi:hypothetical protein ABVK25_002358 [Lepraria finkii]|uniref:Uncharacterized protein n=1 Tax=Lepraria finkii TaxID=1340010 RepID=A0ABR4BHK8_9LECA